MAKGELRPNTSKLGRPPRSPARLMLDILDSAESNHGFAVIHLTQEEMNHISWLWAKC